MSGAAYVGPVPKHWKVRPLRLLGRLLKGTGASKEDIVEFGVPCIRYGDLYTTHNNFIERARTHLTPERALDYTPIEYGDVLFAASGETIEEIGKSAVNLLRGARCGGDLVIFRPTEPTVPRFLGYATDAAPVAAQKSLAGRGTTVKHIYPDELREVVIAVPPIHEQQAIADFLDRETARLDALVAAKQRVLALLAEKRKAIISTAVTRGLDPKAKLRDSGIPWLGEIPAHWEVTPLRYLVSFLSGGTPDKSNSDYWTNGTIPWVSPKDMKVDAIDDSEDHITEDAVDGSATRFVPVGSVLVVVRGMILAHTLPVAVTTGPVTINQDIKALVCVDRILPDFLRAVLAGHSKVILSLADTSAHGTKKLETEILQRFELPVPSLPEQRSIVEHLARATANLQAMSAATESTIALLKERRSALIAAAVTGQLDVEAAK